MPLLDVWFKLFRLLDKYFTYRFQVIIVASTLLENSLLTEQDLAKTFEFIFITTVTLALSSMFILVVSNL